MAHGESTVLARIRMLPRALAQLLGRRQGRTSPEEIRVLVYGKRECGLCDEVKAVLLAVQRDTRFDIEEVDIESSPELYEAYKERIPLVFVNGRLAFKFHLDARELRRRLRRERP